MLSNILDLKMVVILLCNRLVKNATTSLQTTVLPNTRREGWQSISSGNNKVSLAHALVLREGVIDLKLMN